MQLYSDNDLNRPFPFVPPSVNVPIIESISKLQQFCFISLKEIDSSAFVSVIPFLCNQTLSRFASTLWKVPIEGQYLINFKLAFIGENASRFAQALLVVFGQFFSIFQLLFLRPIVQIIQLILTQRLLMDNYIFSQQLYVSGITIAEQQIEFIITIEKRSVGIERRNCSRSSDGNVQGISLRSISINKMMQVCLAIKKQRSLRFVIGLSHYISINN